MTSTASPVITTPPVNFPGSQFGVPHTETIYTVQQAGPERLESVRCVATFASNNATSDVFVVQLCDQSGTVLYEQATPPLLGVDAADFVAFLTWSRLGNDTGQVAAQEQLFSVDNVRRAWCNMRLPDLVLQPGSVVNLLGYFEDGAEAPDVPVSDIAVTVTRNAGAVSTTTLADVFPMLTPTDEG